MSRKSPAGGRAFIDTAEAPEHGLDVADAAAVEAPCAAAKAREHITTARGQLSERVLVSQACRNLLRTVPTITVPHEGLLVRSVTTSPFAIAAMPAGTNTDTRDRENLELRQSKSRLSALNATD